MKLRLPSALLAATFAASILSAPTAQAAASREQLDFFEKKIRPILAENCYKCHSIAEGKKRGELTLDTREGSVKGGELGPAIVPGDLDKSLLIKAVRYNDEDLQMPPKTKLSSAQIADLEAWVKMGAPDPRDGKLIASSPRDIAKKHWAFQPIKKPAVPSSINRSWEKTEIDNFILAELKKNPGKYSYASSGTGGIGHLLMELYKSLTTTFVTHIPYRGAGPALNDTVAGQVPIIFDNLPSALPFIKSGRLIPIVVSAPSRVAALPNVPTFKEVGLEPVNRMAYYGILGPKGLPKEVVDKVNDGVKKALADPAVKKRIEDTDSIIVANTPEQFAAQIKAEYEIYKQVVAKQKLKLE